MNEAGESSKPTSSRFSVKATAARCFIPVRSLVNTTTVPPACRRDSRPSHRRHGKKDDAHATARCRRAVDLLSTLDEGGNPA